MKDICLLIPYYGTLPQWFNIFITSCSYNPEIDFLFVTDITEPANLPENVKFLPLDFYDFKRLASNKLNFEVNCNIPYKICDFRPAFGVIFEDFIREYNFWGHCDVDLFFGNIPTFINDTVLSDYDIITIRNEWCYGPFTLYRNSFEVNTFFKRSADYKTVLTSDEYLGFDECSRIINPTGGREASHPQLLRGGGNSISSLQTEVESMSHLIHNEKYGGDIRIFQKTLVAEGLNKRV